tara:strand:+ start:196 stop:591 length:396 start_codon:yes stop_codon:yes gene_type:complete
MKKTELLEFMDKEQLVKVVNSLIDKNKILKNQLKESEELIETKRNTEDNMLKDMIDKNKELEEWKERSWENSGTLEMIAREVNRSTIFFKDQEKNELITFKNCSNIIDRLQDRLDMNEDGLFICNLTKKPF